MAFVAKGRFFAATVSALLVTAGAAQAAAGCGKSSAGFSEWIQQYEQQAQAQGIGNRAIRALSNVNYATKTINADRNQKSFKYSLDKFMQVRGGQTIISRGKSQKAKNAALFASIERRYGVPAGPLIAIWGMETGFGSFMGNQHTLSAVATLAYDCRRPEYFRDQLNAALQLIDNGTLAPDAKGAMHGEIGQTQFLPVNVLKYGVRWRRQWPHRHGSLQGRRIGIDGELPARPWLAGWRRLPARTTQFRCDPGLERCQCLSAGHRHHRRANRRRIIKLRLNAKEPVRRAGFLLVKSPRTPLRRSSARSL